MDVRPTSPDNDAPTVDLTDYLGKIKHGSTVYVISSSLPDFIERVWPTITRNISFVLVTGAAVTSVPFDKRAGAKNGKALSWAPHEFEKFIEDPRIIHWFTQNCVAKHRKLTAIPLGLDYRWLNRGFADGVSHLAGHAWGKKMTPQAQEQELIDLRRKSRPWAARNATFYADFILSMGNNLIRNDDRNTAERGLAKLSEKDIRWQSVRLDRSQVWQQYANSKFVVSPEGVGLDCYRTWEALLLGSVPVVVNSEFESDVLFHGLPVARLQNWMQLNESALETQFGSILTQSPGDVVHEKLTLRFWLAKIVAAAVMGSM